jgi:hypothetical protein
MSAARARLSRLPSVPILLALLVLVLPSAASAATGDVLSFFKISSTMGSFPDTLANTDEFGGAAVGLGDLDGTGPAAYAVAVGCALDDDGGTDKGAVYILFLSSTGSILSHSKISATRGGLVGPIDIVDEFGTSVAFLGDLDGSGPSAGAIAVGAPGDDDGAGGAGAVYVLFLSSGGTVMSQQKLSRTQGGLTIQLDSLDEFGGSVCGLGDMDGPTRGATTLAVGAVGDDDGGTDKGAVHLLFLNANGTVFSHKKISALAGGFTGTLDAFDDFGSAVMSLHDLDGAGGVSKRALAVGAIGDDDGGADRGAVWITFLSDTGLVLSNAKISMTAGGLAAAGVTLDGLDEFGSSLEIAGDLDPAAASVMTLVVSAGGDDDGPGLDRGAIYLLHLTSAGAVSSASKISDTAGNFSGSPLDDFDNFGSSIAFLGDLDGAGPAGATLCVGASGDEDGGGDRGAVYILFIQGQSILDAPWDPVASAVPALGAASPNPFRASTTIPFQLGGRANVRLEICDVTGRLVRRLDASGLQRLAWDGRDDAGSALPSGTYFMRLVSGGRALTRTGKTVLLR